MPAKPNILLVLTDQQRWDTLGCYGNPHVHSPVLDQLARDGVCFDHTFCNSPICSPSRASLMTGRYPRTTRCRGNGMPIPETETFFTRLLADAGYTCGLIGKLHTSPCHPSVCPGPERRIDDGLSVFEWSNSPGPTPNQTAHAYRDWLEEMGGEKKEPLLIDNRYIEAGRPDHLHATTWACQRGLEFVRRNRGSPWMLNISIFDPHHSFNPPSSALERYLDHLDDLPLPHYTEGELREKPPFQMEDHREAYGGTGGFAFAEMTDRDHRVVRAAYWAMCDFIDRQLGRLLEELERMGERENTLIIFTSDHGEMLGDHGIYLKGPYFYDPAVRVPLIIQGAGVRNGLRSPAMVELVDLAPTILEAAGLPPHPGMQGRSLWPLLTGKVSADRHRDRVFCEYLDAMPFHTNPAAWGTMLRTPTHKLSVDHSHRTGELYDLKTDPGETTNLWDASGYAPVKSDLLLELNHAQMETVDPLPERIADW